MAGTTPPEPELAGPPRRPVVVPAAVAGLAGTDPVRAVWANQLGGVTFAVGTDRYVKWQPPGTAIDLHAEAERLRWLAPHTSVPRLLDVGADDDGRWLVTAALDGANAVDDRWRDDVGTAVDAVARGLRRFHDAVPVDGCPFDWSVERRIDDARRLRAAGQVTGMVRVPDRWTGIDVDEAFRVAADPPPVDRLVVCHGDACAPNAVLDDRGGFLGHVDVGRAGVADRWADLAVASWSLEWNFGPGWEPRFFDAYGAEPDPERIDAYRLLWEL